MRAEVVDAYGIPRITAVGIAEVTSGNFYLVQMGPYSHSDQVALSPGPNYGGDPTFTLRFGGDCSNSPWTIGPGDWLEGKQGNAAGPTESGFDRL